jgi:hypothetical protein
VANCFLCDDYGGAVAFARQLGKVRSKLRCKCAVAYYVLGVGIIRSVTRELRDIAAEGDRLMSAASIQRTHIHQATLALIILWLSFALFSSPALAADRALASYGALCNGSAGDAAELRAAFADASGDGDMTSGF